MNTMTDSKNLAAKAGARAVVTGRRTMTPSEAFVETLVAQGVTEVFGIVGSAYMDALDLFPLAGIRFISVAHEQGGGHMADGYSRVSGRHGVCIAQNGPGITNFVTSVAAAYWAHSPVVVITPETGTMTLGLGGFQETEQLPIFSRITKYQAHVNNKARMAELTSRSFDRAMLEMGPTQLNIPRDYFYGDIECEIPRPMSVERGAGGERSLDAAAELLAAAKFPVILCGGGGGVGAAGRWACWNAAAAWAGLLAEGRQDHPDRCRCEDARAGENDHRRHLRRCESGREGADLPPCRQGAGVSREQGRAPRRHSFRTSRMEGRARWMGARKGRVVARSGQG